MGINEPGMRAEELELAAGELLLSKIREFLDQSILPPHDLAKVETHIRRVDAPGSGVVGQVQDFSSVKQGLRWHATAQDTEAADLLAPFDYDGFDAFGCGGSRRGVPGAAAADNRKVEMELILRPSHEFKMGRLGGAGKIWIRDACPESFRGPFVNREP